MRTRAVLVGTASCIGLCLFATLAQGAQNPARGEGYWGLNGGPIVSIGDVSSSPDIGGGTLLNVSNKPLAHLVLTIGEHYKGTTNIYGTVKLDDRLLPNEKWTWRHEKLGGGFEVLRVTVDGEPLTHLGQ